MPRFKETWFGDAKQVQESIYTAVTEYHETASALRRQARAVAESSWCCLWCSKCQDDEDKISVERANLVLEKLKEQKTSLGMIAITFLLCGITNLQTLKINPDFDSFNDLQKIICQVLNDHLDPKSIFRMDEQDAKSLYLVKYANCRIQPQVPTHALQYYYIERAINFAAQIVELNGVPSEDEVVRNIIKPATDVVELVISSSAASSATDSKKDPPSQLRK